MTISIDDKLDYMAYTYNPVYGRNLGFKQQAFWGQVPGKIDLEKEEDIYCSGNMIKNFIYSELKKIEEYKDTIKKRLLKHGYKYLVSIINPEDVETYRECGATIGYNHKGTLAYMSIEGNGWREEARLFFYENFEHRPDYEVVNEVTYFIKLPDRKKPHEVLANGGKYRLRQSRLDAIHTWATDNVDDISV